MGKPSNIEKTPELIAYVQNLREQCPPEPWARIARKLGVCPRTIRSWCDEDYRVKLRAQQRKWKARPPVWLRYLGGGNPSKEDVAARRAEIPMDTRTLTGRICGDPLPGRSALDKVTERCAHE